MLKNLLIASSISIALSTSAFAADTTATDALGLAGTYKCSGYDMHDGGYKNATVTITLDPKDSDFKDNYGAYHFTLVEADGAKYVGEAAASGNSMAVYFASTTDSSDHGVGIATVIHNRTPDGTITSGFQKFYYEPEYQGGGNGYETCIKQS